MAGGGTGVYSSLDVGVVPTSIKRSRFTKDVHED